MYLSIYEKKKESRRNPARIHSPNPFLRAGNQPKFWQPLSPKNSFAKTSSALKPHHLPEYLEGRTPKEKHPFLFQEKFHPRQIRNARSVFSFGVAEALRGGGGAFVERTIQVRVTTRSVRASFGVLLEMSPNFLV